MHASPRRKIDFVVGTSKDLLVGYSVLLKFGSPFNQERACVWGYLRN